MPAEECESDPARSVWRRIRALVAAPDVAAAEHRFMRDIGLSAGPVRALRALLQTGPLSMRALAGELGCDKSYVTSLVKPLVSNGLVTLEPDPQDGRVKMITLTTPGVSIASRAREVHETPPAALAVLGREAIDQLAQALDAVEPSDEVRAATASPEFSPQGSVQQ